MPKSTRFLGKTPGLIDRLRSRGQRRSAPTFYIWTPRYTHMHSGVRCLHLLCHHLNRLGYRAYITTSEVGPYLHTPYAEPPRRSDNHVVVYPEVVKGNPLGAQRVVRYFLNKPGFLNDFGLEAYGEDEYFIHFADVFQPETRASKLLPLPLIDTTVFRKPGRERKRKGFLVYSVRQELLCKDLPPRWAKHCERISKNKPRTAQELAALYRKSRAFVTSERTAAALEALHCGCPVLVVPVPGYNYQPLIDLVGGNGVGVGLRRESLRHARRTVGQALINYNEMYDRIDDNIHGFVEDVIQFFE